MKVLALPEVRQYLKGLIKILYEKNYFSFPDSAEKYVTDLFNDIKTHLPYKVRKPAPPYFARFGKKMFYATFRKTRGTLWYVFFNIYRRDGETIFLIRYISNNHISAKHFI